MEKHLSIKEARKMVTNPENWEMGTYPEFDETGKCTWSELTITESNMEKLIDEGLIAYSMMEDLYLPTMFFIGETQTYLNNIDVEAMEREVATEEEAKTVTNNNKEHTMTNNTDNNETYTRMANGNLLVTFTSYEVSEYPGQTIYNREEAESLLEMCGGELLVFESTRVIPVIKENR